MQGTARWIVLIAVVLAPWLFGCSEPWAWLALGLLVQGAAFLRLIGILREGYVNAVTSRATLLCALVLACVSFQLLPLPTLIAQWLNPLGTETQTTALRLLSGSPNITESESDAPNIQPNRSCISASPAETRRALHLLVLSALVFLTLLSSISDREETEALAMVLAINGLALAAFAIVQDLSGTRAIYGVYKPRLGGTFYGPFPNRNHFALFLNMTIGCSIALLLASSRHALAPRFLSWGDRIALLSSRRANIIVMLSYAIILMVVASVFSLSRGGLISLFIAGAVLLSFYRVHRRHGGLGMITWTLALAAGAVATWIGWQPLLSRFQAWHVALDPLTDTRWRTMIATFRVWAAAPLVGWGFGVFQHAFPLFQEPSLQVGRFVYAHNDYVQLLAEGGLLSLVAWGAVGAAFIVGAARGYSKASEESRLFFIGLCFALCAAAVHSLVDFGLRKAANAFLLATLLAVALMVTRLPGYGRSYMYETGTSGPRVYLSALLCLLGLLGLFARTWRELSHELTFASALQWRQIMDTSPSHAVRMEAAEALLADAARLLERDLDNPEAYFDIGIILLKTVAEKDLPAAMRIELAKQAETSARTAVRLAPSDYEYWLWYSRILQVNGKPLPARFAAGRAHDLAPPSGVIAP